MEVGRRGLSASPTWVSSGDKADNRAVGRVKVALVSAHPAIASGLETLLALEGRYDVRRLSRPGEIVALRPAWSADVALVDGTLLTDGSSFVLGVPSLVLSGDEASARALSARLDDMRGWVRKDASGGDLAKAIDGVVHVPEVTGGVRAPGGLAVRVAAAIVVIALLYILYVARY